MYTWPHQPYETKASFPSTSTVLVRVPICAKDTRAIRQPDSSFWSGNALLLGYALVGITFGLGRRLHLATGWGPIKWQKNRCACLWHQQLTLPMR